MKISSELIRNALAVLGAVSGTIGLVLAAWFRHSLLPVVRVRLDLKWEPSGLLQLKLNAENTSLVPAKVKSMDVQILEHAGPLPEGETLREFIPFREADFEQGEHSCWREPIRLARSAKRRYIKAGETIAVEMLYRPSSKARAIHCGFRVLLRSRLAWFHGHDLAFTTTAWAPSTNATP